MSFVILQSLLVVYMKDPLFLELHDVLRCHHRHCESIRIYEKEP